MFSADHFRDFLYRNESTILQTVALIVVWIVVSIILNYIRNHYLIQACKQKDYKSYKRWIKYGGNLDCESGKDGAKPMMLASEAGSLEIVRDMISIYPKLVHDHDYQGKTATLYALENNHIDVVKLLLENKARVDDPSDDGATPLITACSKLMIVHTIMTPMLICRCLGLGKADVVEFLLSKGASVKWKTRQGLTALIATVHHQSNQPPCLPILRLLVKHKASVDAALPGGWTALIEACHQGDIDVIEYLIKQGASISAKTEEGMTPFLAACQGGHPATVSLLGSEYSSKFTKEDTKLSLIFACCSGKLDAVKAVIDSGWYDINVTEKDENLTPLMLSMDQESDAIALYLLDQVGINVNAQSTNGWNALFYAAEYDHKAAAEKLIKKGIKLQHADSEQWTALMIATRSNAKDVVEVILNSCSKDFVNVKQSDGWTALAIAVAMDCKEIAALLCSHGADVNTKQDSLAIFSEIRNSLHKRMLAFKCNGDEECPLIMLAVLCENVEIIEILCEAGADDKAKNKAGYNAWDIARRSKKSKEILSILKT